MCAFFPVSVDLKENQTKVQVFQTCFLFLQDQYEFCYRALQEFLDSFDLYANFH